MFEIFYSILSDSKCSLYPDRELCWGIKPSPLHRLPNLDHTQHSLYHRHVHLLSTANLASPTSRQAVPRSPLHIQQHSPRHRTPERTRLCCSEFHVPLVHQGCCPRVLNRRECLHSDRSLHAPVAAAVLYLRGRDVFKSLEFVSGDR